MFGNALMFRDKTMEAHVLEKLSSTDRELKRLQAEEQRIEKDIALKSERKKLRIFQNRVDMQGEVYRC